MSLLCFVQTSISHSGSSLAPRSSSCCWHLMKSALSPQVLFLSLQKDSGACRLQAFDGHTPWGSVRGSLLTVAQTPRYCSLLGPKGQGTGPRGEGFSIPVGPQKVGPANQLLHTCSNFVANLEQVWQPFPEPFRDPLLGSFIQKQPGFPQLQLQNMILFSF